MPILVLTGRNRVEDRVQCLDLGADDYLGMPAESVLAVDDLKLDRAERLVEHAGRRIELTSEEFCLLEYFMRNAGRRITRAMIIEHVWNLSFDTCTNVVDVYVSYSTSQVDKNKVGLLALAIQVAFQELGVLPASNPAVPLEAKDAMPFSTAQAVETSQRVATMGRIVMPSTAHSRVRQRTAI
jgi:CheY-like chemotaxis protein